ncbi:MAG: hypothetical protein ACUVWN_04545 [bacterium]
MIINVGELTYSLEEGGNFAPIPRGLDFEGEVELVGRLHSTTGGGASWSVGGIIEAFLSKSRWEPWIHLKGTARVKEGNYPPYSETFLQIRRKAGYTGRNLMVDISFPSEPKDLTFRKEREQLFASLVLDGEEELTQGHLSIRRVARPFLNGIATRDGVPRLYNHEVICPARWMGLDTRRLIEVSQVGAWVVSPDHLDSPLFLEPGWYVLNHPAPGAD